MENIDDHVDYSRDVETETKPSGLSFSRDTGKICAGSSKTFPLQSTANELQSKRNLLEDAKRAPFGTKRRRREKWRFPRQVSKETSTVLLNDRKLELSSKSRLADLIVDEDNDLTLTKVRIHVT